VEFYRGQMARTGDTLHLSRACVVIALLAAGRTEEASAMAGGLRESAETTHNPYAISYALLVCGMSQGAVDPVGALDALQRGLVIAQDSGNRANVSYLAMALAMTLNRMDDEHDQPLVALDNVALAVRNYHDSANITQLRAALGIFMTFLDRRGDLEPAAVIAGFARAEPTAAPSIPEFSTAIEHLRDVLGATRYESLARAGAEMTMPAVVAFAHDEIDRVRRELERQP
jgi:hypothetical protein